METRFLYSLLWEYRERWRVPVAPGAPESEGYAYVEGTVEGPITGRFRGVNHSRQRADGRFLTNVQGVILARDDIVLTFDYQGVGCPYPVGPDPLQDRTRVTLAARHQSDHPDWSHLNDAVCIGIGENRFTDDGVRLLLLDVSEVLWEPFADDRPTARPDLADPVPIESGFFDLDAITAARAAAGH